jgi:hypothetical protein
MSAQAASRSYGDDADDAADAAEDDAGRRTLAELSSSLSLASLTVVDSDAALRDARGLRVSGWGAGAGGPESGGECEA